MSYYELEENMQKQQSAIFEKYGVGFAFSDKQFNEYVEGERAKGYEGRFTHISNIPGMYCRSETADAMIEELKKKCMKPSIRKCGKMYRWMII